MMDTTPDSQNIAEPIVQKSIGTDLRIAREAQGLSIGDVAQRTKFSVHQVEALEADDLARLPQGTFLRGFVRSYARVLMLDENTLLERIPPHADPVVETAVDRAERKVLPSGEITRRNNIYLFVAALVVVLLLVAFVWNSHDEPKMAGTVVEEIRLPVLHEASAPIEASAETPAVETAAAEQVKVESAPVVTTQIIERKIPESKSLDANKGANNKKDQVKTSAVKPEPPKKTLLTPPVVVPLVPGKPEAALDVLMKRPIHIVFIEDTWMEIIDTNGDVLLSRMNRAGSEKWIGGGRRAPYEISIGKASAVHIYYKGHEVDLSHYDPAQGANLVLE